MSEKPPFTGELRAWAARALAEYDERKNFSSCVEVTRMRLEIVGRTGRSVNEVRLELAGVLPRFRPPFESTLDYPERHTGWVREHGP